MPIPQCEAGSRIANCAAPPLLGTFFLLSPNRPKDAKISHLLRHQSVLLLFSLRAPTLYPSRRDLNYKPLVDGGRYRDGDLNLSRPPCTRLDALPRSNPHHPAPTKEKLRPFLAAARRCSRSREWAKNHTAQPWRQPTVGLRSCQRQALLSQSFDGPTGEKPRKKLSENGRRRRIIHLRC